MGNFRLLDNDKAWKAAGENAQRRENEMRGDSTYPKENFFKPGEFGKWWKIKEKLEEDLRKAVLIREKNLNAAMKKVILEAYTSEDGQKLPDQVADHVTRSMTRALIVYHLIRTQVMAVTDDEITAALKGAWQPSLAEVVATRGQAEKCPWTIAEDWPAIKLAYIYQTYSDDEIRWVIQNGTHRWLAKRQKQTSLRTAIMERLKKEKKTVNYNLVLEDAEFNRVVEARRSQKTMTEMLAQEMKHDAEDLKTYAVVSKELSEIDSKERLHLIQGYNVAAIHKSIDENEAKGLFDKKTADGFKAYFNVHSKVKSFRAYMNDPEWSKRSSHVGLESEFLDTLTGDEAILGQLVEFIYERANAEQTKVVQDRQKKLALLCRHEAAALKMAEFKEYL